jgi:ParB family chromosome partitioning protein
MGFDSYQLISGERRTRASRLAGLTHIPAYIRLANDQEMLEMALIENIQREDLNAIEVAISYKRLMDECSLNQEQLGDRVGKNRSTVSNYLRLLNLPDNIQAALRDDKISMGHARAIIGIDDADEQQYLFDQMIENNLSVRAVESLVRKASEESSQKAKEGTRKKSEPSETYVDFQTQLSSKFDAKIKIKADDRGRGSITIPFKSQQDLQRILDLI